VILVGKIKEQKINDNSKNVQKIIDILPSSENVPLEQYKAKLKGCNAKKNFFG